MNQPNPAAARPGTDTAQFWIYPVISPALTEQIGCADGRPVLVRRIRVIPEHFPGGMPLPTPHQVWEGFALFTANGALLRLYVRPFVGGALHEWILPKSDRNTAAATLEPIRPSGAL